MNPNVHVYLIMCFLEKMVEYNFLYEYERGVKNKPQVPRNTSPKKGIRKQ